MTVQRALALLAVLLLAGCTAPMEAEWTFAANQTPASTPLRLETTAPPVTVKANGNTLQPVLETIRTPRHDYLNHAWPRQLETLHTDTAGTVTARTTGAVERIELRLFREPTTLGAAADRSNAAGDAQRVVVRNVREGAYTGLVTVRPERITYRYRFRLRVR